MTAPLDKLHDFYQPSPPSWRPQTIGWYVVFAIAALLLLWLVIHLVRRWIANRYRREAMRELAHARPEQLSALLKVPRSPHGRARKSPLSAATLG
jgi:hypothetical protein